MILKVVLVYFNRLCGGLLMTVVVVVVVFFFFLGGLWLPQWWWWWLMVVVLGFLRWVGATTMVLVVVLICGFLVVQFGFDGFFLLWVLGLWVLFATLSSTSLSSSHGEASLY